MRYFCWTAASQRGRRCAAQGTRGDFPASQGNGVLFERVLEDSTYSASASFSTRSILAASCARRSESDACSGACARVRPPSPVAGSRPRARPRGASPPPSASPPPFAPPPPLPPPPSERSSVTWSPSRRPRAAVRAERLGADLVQQRGEVSTVAQPSAGGAARTERATSSARTIPRGQRHARRVIRRPQLRLHAARPSAASGGPPSPPPPPPPPPPPSPRAPSRRRVAWPRRPLGCGGGALRALLRRRRRAAPPLRRRRRRRRRRRPPPPRRRHRRRPRQPRRPRASAASAAALASSSRTRCTWRAARGGGGGRADLQPRPRRAVGEQADAAEPLRRMLASCAWASIVASSGAAPSAAPPARGCLGRPPGSATGPPGPSAAPARPPPASAARGASRAWRRRSWRRARPAARRTPAPARAPASASPPPSAAAGRLRHVRDRVGALAQPPQEPVHRAWLAVDEDLERLAALVLLQPSLHELRQTRSGRCSQRVGPPRRF